jgi:hypothetical protein
MKPRLILLTRPGCHLCEEFREEFEAQYPEHFELTEACVDDREEWVAQFGREIPVLLAPDGEVISRTRLDHGAVARHLARR